MVLDLDCCAWLALAANQALACRSSASSTGSEAPRAVTSHGVAGEIVQAVRRDKVEHRFRAPVHLLAVCERGVRRDGETFVEGLPRSSLRDLRRKLTFVPAGHEFHEWQDPQLLARV